MPRVTGIDLSFTGTGIVTWNGKKALDCRLVVTGTKDGTDQDRHRYIADEILLAVLDNKPHRIAIEDYIRRGMKNFNNVVRLAELGGVVKLRLWEAGFQWVTYTPTEVKLFATGKGNASKVDMVFAAKKIISLPDNNVADGLHIARYAWNRHYC